MDTIERIETAKNLSSYLPKLPPDLVWTESDVDALRAAFKVRFNEDVPRTETLFAVAAIGYRRCLADQNND